MDDLKTTPREQHNRLGTFASWSGGHYCSSYFGPKPIYLLKKNGLLNDNIIYLTFKFQFFVNDFDELCLFHDLKFTLILVWFPWVIPISSAYFFSNYFNIIICLIILISSSWQVFFSCSILNYINIVININVIVKLNYIFLIIIKKNTD